MGMSHATCTHPRTPAGRAACRKAGGPNTDHSPTPFMASPATLAPSTNVLRGLGDVRRLATSLMTEHGLTASGWTFDFDNGKRRFGACHWRGKNKITLSSALTQANINKPEIIRDVVLHEIAHALAGPRAHHGPAWKSMARRIGANPTRCYDSNGVTGVDAPYTATCGGCGATFRKFRKPRAQRACAACCRRAGRMDPRFFLTFTYVGS